MWDDASPHVAGEQGWRAAALMARPSSIAAARWAQVPVVLLGQELDITPHANMLTACGCAALTRMNTPMLIWRRRSSCRIFLTCKEEKETVC